MHSFNGSAEVGHCGKLISVRCSQNRNFQPRRSVFEKYCAPPLAFQCSSALVNAERLRAGELGQSPHSTRNDVNQVLQVSGQWTWGHAYSERPAPEPGLSVSFNSSSIHSMGKDEPQKLTSRGRTGPGSRTADERPLLEHVAYLSGSSAGQFRCLLRCPGQGTKRVRNRRTTVRREQPRIGITDRHMRRWRRALPGVRL